MGLTHVAVATAASVSNTSCRMLHSGSDVRYGCVNVWLAIQWPSFTARATTLEYPATCCPITKNEALTFFSARMSSNRAVLRPQSGTGTCTHNKQRYYRWQARYNPPHNTYGACATRVATPRAETAPMVGRRTVQQVRRQKSTRTCAGLGIGEQDQRVGMARSPADTWSMFRHSSRHHIVPKLPRPQRQTPSTTAPTSCRPDLVKQTRYTTTGEARTNRAPGHTNRYVFSTQ